MEENGEKIDLLIIFRKILARRKLFYKIIPVSFLIASIFILGFPRYYVTDIKLAPELNNSSGTMGTLGSIASSFGFDLNDMQTSDAITPLLYPNLMEDNKFICELFDVIVETADGKVKSSYRDYLVKEQSPIIWLVPVGWVKNLLKKQQGGGDAAFNPYYLSKMDDEIANTVRGSISLKVDKKTAIVTIEAKAQDPLVCKMLADSVKAHLQNYIIDYRTSKARNDYEYYDRLVADAKRDYEASLAKYAHSSDATTHVSLKSAELRLEDMENDLQLKFTAYSTLNNQLQAAKAKIQERTPAFTVIKGADVPVKPSGPKRMVFVIAMMLVTFALTCVYILAVDEKKQKVA